ncbi:MAG: hypothetical protein IPJ84_16590 [Bdellovibrionales bacterium]|nr:hypothetical protein [Bdellovibrionales bacterium]
MNRLFVSFVCLVTLSACTPAPEQPPIRPKQVETTKPVPFARVRIVEKTLREFSRIERPLKAYFAAQTIDAIPSCATVKHPVGYISVTTWACGTDPSERGRREIVGSETVRYSKDKSSLVYTAQLTITNFDDLEVRADAHALEIQRKMVIDFADSSSRSNINARVSGYIRSALKPSNKWQGSNFEIKLKGLLGGDALNPILRTGSSLDFSGALWGENDLRSTKFGAGQYTHIADSDIEMKSSNADACFRPVGSWKLSTEGGGATGRHDVTSSLSSVDEEGGMSLAWDSEFCNSP